MRLKPIIVATVAILLVASALAGEVSDVVVAGQIAFRITDPGSFGSISARGTDVDQRICEAISSEDVGNPRMMVALRQGLWAVYVGNTYLVSVYPGDAKLYATPAKKLATTWASKLKALFPLAQPMGKAGVNSRTTAMDLKAAQAALLRQVKVPEEHWGIVARYMIVLWDARQVKMDDMAAVEGAKLSARMIEDGARHYYVPAEAKPGHEPGKCDHMKSCEVCQAMMDAAVATPEAKRDAAAQLAKLLATDDLMNRAVRQALEYCRSVPSPRFMRERARVAWQLYQRLNVRAGTLHVAAEATVAGAPCAPTTPAAPAPEGTTPPAPSPTPAEKPGG